MMRERDSLPMFIKSKIQGVPLLGGLRSTLLNLTLPNLTSIEDVHFDKFWNVYPRKESKGNAEKSFLKAMALTDLETILAGVEFYNARIRKEKIEKQFIKLPATWLNQKCWEDKPTSTPTPPPKKEEVKQEKVVLTSAQAAAAKLRLQATRNTLSTKLTSHEK